MRIPGTCYIHTSINSRLYRTGGAETAATDHNFVEVNSSITFLVPHRLILIYQFFHTYMLMGILNETFYPTLERLGRSIRSSSAIYLRSVPFSCHSRYPLYVTKPTRL